MTKFEEELFNKVPCKFELTTEAEYKKTTLINHFKNWHSDEEFQELLDKYSNLNDHYEKEVIRSSKLESQIANLKSQLQQQALPVVPEDVAKWIEDLKSKGYGPLKNPGTYGEAISDLSDESLEKILTWISQHQEEFMRAWLDGYTVEKPQLFYLREKNTGYYLRKTGNNRYGITAHYSNDFNEKYMHYKFTQQEIDSMQTGSYEQIEVEK